jgi:lipoprotein-anchoring transpeptidase ErfK/SrfK
MKKELSSFRKESRAIAALLIWCLQPAMAVPPKTVSEAHLYIDRKARMLYAIDAKNAVIDKFPVGIGKGGLKKKSGMSDNVTPTGEFTVELVLSKNTDNNAVKSSFLKKYKSSTAYCELVRSKMGLARLFQYMNSIDFDNDGKPDNAYGSAYIGLTSRQAITGPKMRNYGKTPYWYSIAIHGTSDPRNIGLARSGGCVHLSEAALMKLIGEYFVKIGTRVTIADSPPS